MEAGHTVVATDLSQTFIHSTEIDGTLLYTSSARLLLICDCWCILFLKYNDYV